MTAEFPSYERAMTMLILAGIAIGTDGASIIMVMPARLPSKTRRWFEAALDQHRAAVIAAIQRGGRA